LQVRVSKLSAELATTTLALEQVVLICAFLCVCSFSWHWLSQRGAHLQAALTRMDDVALAAAEAFASVSLARDAAMQRELELSRRVVTSAWFCVCRPCHIRATCYRCYFLRQVAMVQAAAEAAMLSHNEERDHTRAAHVGVVDAEPVVFDSCCIT
jgi:hypothetical protein